jgi:arylsulfatase A-like enzyme
MASVMTGLYPRQHGAVDLHWGLAGEVSTLAELLAARDFDTRGYVSHIQLKPNYGLDRGFTAYDYSVLDRGDPHQTSTGVELTDLAIAGLAAVRSPFLVWVHYFDPHFEYLAHQPWSHFGDGDVERYDQEVALVDGEIGRLLGALDEQGLADDTLVIVVGDHGEEFGEHGGHYHYTCHEEVVRIPLVIRAPGRDAASDGSHAEQIDIVPTVLEALGVPVPDGLPGRNLLASEREGRPVFIERERPPGFRQRSVVFGDYKLVHVARTDTMQIPERSRGIASTVENLEPGFQMYDLSRDGEERWDLFSTGSVKARELATLLVAHHSGQRTKSDQIELDEQTREQLRKLGYIE